VAHRARFKLHGILEKRKKEREKIELKKNLLELHLFQYVL